MLEQAKNYLVSVTERSLGIEAAKELYQEEKPDPNKPYFKAARRFALIRAGAIGLIQVGAPSIYRSLMDEYNGIRIDREHTKPYEYTYLKLAGFGAAFLADFASTGLAVSMSHNPIEAVLFKVAANGAANISGDLVVGAVNRIKNFRPTSITLAA